MTARHSSLALASVLVMLAVCHLLTARSSEPFFNNDETRHVMTGVCVRDALHDLPESAANPKAYAVRYYFQYPALGWLVWPPFFYFVEGLAMFALGTSFEVGRACIAGFALLSLLYTYRLAARTHGPRWGLAATLLAGLSPLVFLLSQRVMLEVPTLALVLASLFHFERYLGETRRRDAWLACIFAALAALTRFDAVFLLMYFVLRLLFVRGLTLVRNREVILGVIAALLLTAPYYWLTLREYGGMIDYSVKKGTGTESTGLGSDFAQWIFYPACVPEQTGWVMALAAAVGLVFAISRRDRRGSPYLILLVAIYLTFTPMAEREARHAIYWLPALAMAALSTIEEIRLRMGVRAAAVALTVLVAATAAEGMLQPIRSLKGYGDAAEYVKRNASGDRPVMIDGELTGAFVYQMRQHDPERKLWVLRGDKALYSVLCDSDTYYEEKADTPAKVLEILHQYDPEYLVIEDPQVRGSVPAGERFREVLATHPEKFVVVHRVKIRSNHAIYEQAWLTIYRKLDANPDRKRPSEIDIHGLGKKLMNKQD